MHFELVESVFDLAIEPTPLICVVYCHVRVQLCSFVVVIIVAPRHPDKLRGDLLTYSHEQINKWLSTWESWTPFGGGCRRHFFCSGLCTINIHQINLLFAMGINGLARWHLLEMNIWLMRSNIQILRNIVWNQESPLFSYVAPTPNQTFHSASNGEWFDGDR